MTAQNAVISQRWEVGDRQLRPSHVGWRGRDGRGWRGSAGIGCRVGLLTACSGLLRLAQLPVTRPAIHNFRAPVANVRAMAEGISPRHLWQKMGAMASTDDSTHVSTLHSCTTPLHLVPCANLVRRVTLNLAPASWSCRLLRCRRS